MKRILSIILCVAMLMSMVAMTVNATDENIYWGEYEDQVTTTNKMSFKTDKESYAPGDEVVITATMDSIWGDPTLVDDIQGYEGSELPGAYGMSLIASTLIFPLDTFTPLAGKDLLSSSTITNIETGSVVKTPLADAKKGGFYNFQVSSPNYPFNDDEDAYVFFTGSGDLFNYRLTVNEDAKPGTYKLPVGPYVITDYETGADKGFLPEFEFFGQWYAWIGNSDSLLKDRAMDYGAGLVSVDDPSYLTNIAYIEITISAGEATEEDIAAAAAVDALIDQIGNAPVHPWIDAVNNDGVYTHLEPVTGSNFVITLDMKKGAGNDNTFGFIGGVTDLDGATPRLFYNPAVNKFQIAKTNSWMNASEVTEVLAESDVIVLNDWAKVEFIYAGDDLSIEVNDEVVCSYTYAGMPYQFYIFYPSKACVFVREFKAEGDFGSWAADCTNGSTFNATVFGSHAAYGEGSLDTYTALVFAEDAYAALTDLQKYLVTKYDALVAARTAYDQDQAAAVDAMIDAIGEVQFAPGTDRDSLPAIEAAEAAYAALTEDQKAYVTKLDDLTAAREYYEKIFDLNDQSMAGYVVDAINAIGTVTFDSRDAIENAEDMYAALTDRQKGYVTNYDVLVAARAEYDKYAPIMAVENIIDAIGPIKYVGNVIHHNIHDSNGYANIPRTDGENIVADFTFTFDFMVKSYDTTASKGADITLFRNGEACVGYNFNYKSFVVCNGGGWMSDNSGEISNIYAQAEYELTTETWYNMSIIWVGDSITITLNGETVLECADLGAAGGDTGYSYSIFYPHNVDLYIGEHSAEAPESPIVADFLVEHGYGIASVDVKNPVDYEAKIVAAEEAVAALSEEQVALLSQEYKDALAQARADYEALYAEIVAAAEAVEAQFEAMAVFADIAAAEAAYNALTPLGKSLVENYATFEANSGKIVSDIIAAMATEADIVAANNAYNSLTDGSKANVTNYDVLQAARAALVDEKIAAIGDVTKDSNAVISAAEAAYNGLTEAEKALVVNTAVMTAARAEYNAIIADAAAVDAMIGALTYGGSAVKMVFNGNGYSQLDPNPGTGEFTFGLAMYIESVQEGECNIIGGATSTELWAGYDIAGKRLAIANRGVFDGTAFEDSEIIAQYPVDLGIGTWNYVEFVYGADYITIKLNGKEVLTANVDRAGSDWYIFYPRFVEFYMDNIHVDYWAGSELTSEFSGYHSVWWFGSEGTYWAVNDAPAGEALPETIAAARAAYDALSDKAKAAVTKYDALLYAEMTPAEKFAYNLKDLVVPTANVDNYAEVLAKKADIVAAYEIYKSLSAEDQAAIDVTVLTDALKSYNSALILDAAINEKLVAPQNVVAVGGEGEITVSWDAVANGVKYWVYVDGYIVTTTTDTSVVVAAPAGEHTVKVAVAVNDAPELDGYGVYVSGTSAEVACTVAEVVPASLVVTAEATDDSITASWNAIADNAVYYVTFNIGGTEVVVKTQATTITLAKYVTASTEYSVTVKALVATGTDAYDIYDSNAATGVTAEAIPFEITAAGVADDVLTIEWNAYKGAARYYILITSVKSGKVTTLRIDDVANTTYSLSAAGLTVGDEYSVVVKAMAAGAFYDTAAVTFVK